MKIFCTSDIHGRLKDLKKIIDFVNSTYDIHTVIFAGDIAKDYKWSSISELAEKQVDDYVYPLKKCTSNFTRLTGNVLN